MLAAYATGVSIPPTVVVALLLITLVGFADDCRSLPAAARLASQVAIGIGLGFSLGGGIGAAVGVVVIPAAVNSVNFMDGINGITGISMAVWGLSAMLAGHLHGSPVIGVLGAATAGSALAFLPLNLSVGGLFLGDVGSYMFGALAGATILIGAMTQLPLALLVAPLALYVSDVAITLVKRAMAGQSLMAAHREHTYQRLVRLPYASHVAVAASVGGLSVIITLTWLLPWPGISILLTAVLVVVYLVSPKRLGRARPKGVAA